MGAPPERHAGPGAIRELPPPSDTPPWEPVDEPVTMTSRNLCRTHATRHSRHARNTQVPA